MTYITAIIYKNYFSFMNFLTKVDDDGKKFPSRDERWKFFTQHCEAQEIINSIRRTSNRPEVMRNDEEESD
jgi:hypothetical protein